MKKEYKILLYAYPFIIVISILATVGVPLFALADVAFLVLYYYICLLYTSDAADD